LRRVSRSVDGDAAASATGRGAVVDVEQKFMNNETFLWLNERRGRALIRIVAVVIAARIHILAELQNAEWPIGHLRPPVT